MEYATYKHNLVSNYERLQKINNLPLFDRYKRYRCLLIIDDIGI